MRVTCARGHRTTTTPSEMRQKEAALSRQEAELRGAPPCKAEVPSRGAETEGAAPQRNLDEALAAREAEMDRKEIELRQKQEGLAAREAALERLLDGMAATKLNTVRHTPPRSFVVVVSRE